MTREEDRRAAVWNLRARVPKVKWEIDRTILATDVHFTCACGLRGDARLKDSTVEDSSDSAFELLVALGMQLHSEGHPAPCPVRGAHCVCGYRVCYTCTVCTAMRCARCHNEASFGGRLHLDHCPTCPLCRAERVSVMR